MLQKYQMSESKILLALFVYFDSSVLKVLLQPNI